MAKIEINDLIKNTTVGQRYEGLIGGKMSWSASAANNGALHSVTWKFNVFGCAVVAYDQTDDEASVRAFLGVGNRADWYWAATGAITLTVTAVVNGQPLSRAVEIKIVAPIISDSSAATRASHIRTSPVPGRDATDDRFYLEFKRDDDAGFKWSGTVTCPANPVSSGKISTLQLLKVCRRKVTIGNVTEEKKTDEYVLDQEVHYGLNRKDGKDCNTIAILSGGSQKFTVDDSPATFIDRRGGRTYKEVSVNEDYRMFLMYQPDGGIWVAIGELRWRWSSGAVFDVSSDSWRTSSGDGSSSENLCPSPEKLVSSRLPIWSENVSKALESDH